jgi:hypothetical protein
MSTLREKRQRFSADDDLCLLREVTAQNPIKEAKAWSTVQENIEKTVGKKFSMRTLKDHLQLLLEIYLKKDMVSQKKSGVEEIFSERDNLLQEISDLCKEFKKSRRPKVNKVEQIVNLGKQVRDEQALHYPTSTRRHGNFAGVHTLLRILLSSNSAVLINIITGVSPPHFDFVVYYVLCQCYYFQQNYMKKIL